MARTTQAGWREALADLSTRRSLLGASLLGSAGLLAASHQAEAKKKRKKRCRNGAKRCGKGCCKAPSICSAGSCFCTGSESKCTSISDELIKLIAEALGIPPENVGANPDQPLAQCPDIQEQLKDQINFEVDKQFGVTGPVNWCEGGITAGTSDIILEITSKK